jgi:hypothetical protein
MIASEEADGESTGHMLHWGMTLFANPFKSMTDPRTLCLQRLRDGVPVELARAALNARTDEEAAIAEGAIARFVRLEEVGNSTALLAAARRYELGTYRATVDVTGNATDPAGLQAARDDVARARAAREAAEERLRNAQE